MESAENSHRRWAFAASAIIHGAVAAYFLFTPHAIFVKPVTIARGQLGTSIVYMEKFGETTKPATEFTKPPKIKMPAKQKPAPQLAVAKSKGEKRALDEKNATLAGSLNGSASVGELTGSDIRPALPILFPDPAVPRSLVPSGVQGDVIVEVTIDASGNVAETKIVRSLGYGVDERVVETVRNWHFRPATRDGVAIASKQDVLYHFPS